MILFCLFNSNSFRVSSSYISSLSILVELVVVVVVDGVVVVVVLLYRFGNPLGLIPLGLHTDVVELIRYIVCVV